MRLYTVMIGISWRSVKICIWNQAPLFLN